MHRRIVVELDRIIEWGGLRIPAPGQVLMPAPLMRAARGEPNGTGRRNRMGADCTHARYGQRMSTIIQVRGVPDDVRDALAAAAAAEGISLTSYVRRELEHVARRAERVHGNRAVVRATKERVGTAVDRDTILATLRDGRPS